MPAPPALRHGCGGGGRARNPPAAHRFPPPLPVPADPLYKWLRKEKGGFLLDAVKWNFTKFLVDKEGHVVQRYSPTTKPASIEKDIEAQLAA